MKSLILLAAFLTGCALAIGDNSRALVNTDAEARREVTKETPTLEQVIVPKKEKSQ